MALPAKRSAMVVAKSQASKASEASSSSSVSSYFEDADESSSYLPSLLITARVSALVLRGQRQSVLGSFCNGLQLQPQNPKCQQFLLVATSQTPENHGCTLCRILSPPNPFVFFPMGQQSAPRSLGASDLAPIFGFESVGHGGPLQHVL